MKIIIFISLLALAVFLQQCSSNKILMDPGSSNSQDACLVIFGIVELIGPTSIGNRKSFNYRVYEPSYLLLQEVRTSDNEAISKLSIERIYTTGSIYKPKFGVSVIVKESVLDKVIDPKSIYYAFTGLAPGKSYSIHRIGYTKTEVYKSGDKTYTRSIPINITGDPIFNFQNFPIICEPNKPSFLGIAEVSVGGKYFSIKGDALKEIQEKAENSDLDYFFGPYENTRKGAAWYVRDKLFEVQTTGYWHNKMYPNQKSIGR